MSDWQNKSDFEINSAVTATVNDCAKWEANDVEFYHCGIDGSAYYSIPILDYCNNPSDAWPIIIKNKISIMSDGDLWEASIDFDGDLENHSTDEVLTKHYEHANPLRAAMIVYLEINGVKPNE